MKNKKTRLWWADRLRLAILGLMLIFAMFGYAGSIVGLIGIFLALPGFIAVEFLMNRCPHCDRHLDRNWGQFCQYCGGRVREDKSET